MGPWDAALQRISRLTTQAVSEGFRDLLTRMTRWRVGARWYALALLTAPLLVTATLLALSLSSPVFLPRILTSNEKATLMLFGIGWGWWGVASWKS